MNKSIVFSLFILLIYSQNSFCQLKVTSSGHIGIATDVANSVLSVGGYGHDIFTAQFSPVQGRKSVSICNVSYTTEFPLGLYIENAIYNTDSYFCSDVGCTFWFYRNIGNGYVRRNLAK